MTKSGLNILILLFFFVSAFSQIKDTSALKNRVAYTSVVHSGSFLAWHEPKVYVSNGLEVSGSKQIKKAFLEGAIAYNNTIKNQTIWPYIDEDNYPYTIADQSLKRMTGNNIDLYGNYCYDLSSLLKIGMDVNYTTGSTYNQQDPRYRIDDYQLIASPKLFVRLAKLNLWVFPYYSMAKSELSMTTISIDRATIYQHLGLGNMQNPEQFDLYTGQISKDSYGLNSGLYYKSDGFKAGTGFNLHTIETNTDRSNHNWSVIIPEVQTQAISLTFEPSVEFISGNFKHNFLFANHSISKTGREFIRVKVTEGSILHEIWQTFGKVDKLQIATKTNDAQYKLTYSRNLYNFELNPQIELITHKEIYHGINQDWNYNKQLLRKGIGGGFSFKNPQKEFALNAVYNNISALELDYKGANGVYTEWIYLHEINYYRQTVHSVTLNAIFGKKISIGSNPMFARIKANAGLISQKESAKNRLQASITLEVDF